MIIKGYIKYIQTIGENSEIIEKTFDSPYSRQNTLDLKKELDKAFMNFEFVKRELTIAKVIIDHKNIQVRDSKELNTAIEVLKAVIWTIANEI